MKKWAPFASLIEQSTCLEKMRYERNKIEKPKISSDKAREINMILANYHGEDLKIKYFYDEKNNLIKEVMFDLDEKKSYTRTYVYKSFDKMGNWLTRVVNCEKDDIKNGVQTRTVEY